MDDAEPARPGDKVVGNDEARSVLTKLGLTGPEQDDALAGLAFPTPLSSLLTSLRRAGLDEDDLFDELGASP